jgi:putative ATP-binding cassette transporter
VPDGAHIMITPQKSYLPLGSLKGALLYPEPDLMTGNDRLIAALQRVGLESLVPRLDEVARWDQVLANGERQRLAIARLLVHRPQVVILDDALSALEEPAQKMLLSRLKNDLPGATIISLGQRAAADGQHDRQFALERNAHGAVLAPVGTPALANAT